MNIVLTPQISISLRFPWCSSCSYWIFHTTNTSWQSCVWTNSQPVPVSPHIVLSTIHLQKDGPCLPVAQVSFNYNCSKIFCFPENTSLLSKRQPERRKKKQSKCMTESIEGGGGHEESKTCRWHCWPAAWRQSKTPAEPQTNTCHEHWSSLALVDNRKQDPAEAVHDACSMPARKRTQKMRTNLKL